MPDFVKYFNTWTLATSVVTLQYWFCRNYYLFITPRRQHRKTQTYKYTKHTKKKHVKPYITLLLRYITVTAPVQFSSVQGF